MELVFFIFTCSDCVIKEVYNVYKDIMFHLDFSQYSLFMFKCVIIQIVKLLPQ